MQRRDSSEPPIPRTVKPRRTGYVHRPIIVADLDAETMFFERTGEVREFWSAAIRLPAEPSSIIVAPDGARLVAVLHELYHDHPRWQYRLTPLKRPVMKPNGELSKWTIATTIINFFGWQRDNGHATNLYHHPLDPGVFLRGPVADLLDLSDTSRLAALLDWAKDVRAWCEEQNLRLTPTAGGLAGQLLRDPRWFPDARRKVPHQTNARVRPQLPGNYYRLFADEDKPYTALYLDMSASHHTIAASLDFPHPDHLTARGHFHVTDETGVTVTEGRPWLKPGSRAFERITTEAHGLIYGMLEVPFLRDHQFPPPYMRNPGAKMVWAYTNELPMIAALGGHWRFLSAAWVSFQTDPGINRYAQFALAQLRGASDDRKRWLKPALLSTYGILAAQERRMEVAYYRAKSGEDRRYPAGPSMLPGRAHIGAMDRESAVVNVMYRGLIEAEQRRITLTLARELHTQGHRVLAIYADSIFTEGINVPLLPQGWKVEAALDGLVFASATHFTSRQLSKLPGVRKDSSERVQLLAQIRGHDTPRHQPPRR